MRRWMAAIAMVLFAANGAAAQEWKAPTEAKGTKNPVAKAKGIKEGKEEYEKNCAVCHAKTGKGDGPGAAALSPKPKDLSDTGIQAQADGELLWKISEGRGAMPPWKQLPGKDRWSLVHYVRSLAGKK